VIFISFLGYFLFSFFISNGVVEALKMNKLGRRATFQINKRGKKRGNANKCSENQFDDSKCSLKFYEDLK